MTIQFRYEMGKLSYVSVIGKLVLFVSSEVEYMAIFIGAAGK